MLTVKKHRLSIIVGTAIIGMIVLSILSIGALILPKNESIANDLTPPIVNNTSSSQEINDTSSVNQVNDTLSNKPQIPIQDHSFPIELQNNSDIVNGTLTEQYTFQVTTDSGYSCTSGDPTQAIQNAINTLPDRTAPAKIMLQGQFDNVGNINLADNIFFEGNNATLTATDHSKIFILKQNGTYSETYKTFSLNNTSSYADWINLHNVTFSNINFKHNLQDSYSFAIYLYESNGTGWGISQNINVYNCTFTGFYSGFYILPINSSYSGNYFSNFTGNGFMLPYGADINITSNNFITSSSQQGAYPKIGLHLLDIEGTYCLVSNNTFSTDSNSAGLAVVSSTGDINITENLFTGNGTSCLIDFYARPFTSSGVHIFSNNGLEDFSI